MTSFVDGRRGRIGLAVVLGLSCGRAAAAPGQSFAGWLAFEADKATAEIRANIGPLGTPPGFVVASPSTQDPDYFFHWTRDGALTMTAVLDLALASNDVTERAGYFRQLADYAVFTRETQLRDTMSGLVADGFANVGEPKFNPDGSGYTGAWGRPQADGPALRAILVLRLLAVAYDPLGVQRAVRGLPADAYTEEFFGVLHAVADTDLTFLLDHGLESSFDLWEEVRGEHFYTGMVQHRALVMAAAEARRRGDRRAARAFRTAALALEDTLPTHWDARRGYLVQTLKRDGGADYKVSNLDTGVVLGALHAAGDDGYFAPTDARVLATAVHLKRAFRGRFAVNAETADGQGQPLEAAIGRYPEDRYDGNGSTGGNPWVLATLAMAELDYRVASRLADTGTLRLTRRNIEFFQDLPLGGVHLRPGTTLAKGHPAFGAVLKGLVADGDAFLARVRFHTPTTGGLSEQIDGSAGTMRGARDLTWSYAAYLTALWEREKALRAAGAERECSTP